GAWVLRDHDDEQLDELHDALIDLPSVDPSLLWPLPRLLTPELVGLGAALADQDEDTEAVWGLLGGVLARLDTPRARAGLARAVLALRGGGRLDLELAAAGVIDLASPPTTRVRARLPQGVGAAPGAGRGGGPRPCCPLDQAGGSQSAAGGRRGRRGGADRQRTGG